MSDAVMVKSSLSLEKKDLYRLSIYSLSIFIIVFLSLFKIIPILTARILTTGLLVAYFAFIKLIDKNFNLSRLVQYLIIFLPLIYYTEYLFFPNFIDYLFISTFILFIVLFAMKRNLFKEYFKFIKSEKALLFLSIFLVSIILWSSLSFIWAIEPDRVFARLQFLFYALFMFLFFSFLLYSSNHKLLLYNFVLSTLILILVGSCEVIFNVHFQISHVVRKNLAYTPGGLSSNVNNFSVLLFCGLSYIMIFMSTFKNKIKYFIQILIGILLSVILFYFFIKTKSRANILAMIIYWVCILLISFIFIVGNFYVKIKKNYARFLFILLTSALLIICILVTYNFSKDYLEKTIDSLKKSIETSKKKAVTSDQVRINLIRNGLIMLKNSHFLGVGAGNFIIYEKEYTKMHYKTRGITDSHNLWLEMLVDYGVIIFSFFVFLYVFLIVKSLRLFFSSNKSFSQRAKYLYSFSALAGFTISSLSPSNIVASPIMWIFLSFIALVLSKEYDK